MNSSYRYFSIENNFFTIEFLKPFGLEFFIHIKPIKKEDISSSDVEIRWLCFRFILGFVTSEIAGNIGANKRLRDKDWNKYK